MEKVSFLLVALTVTGKVLNANYAGRGQLGFGPVEFGPGLAQIVRQESESGSGGGKSACSEAPTGTGWCRAAIDAWTYLVRK